ncbi:unnamed protein product [Dovyalis caffra]|uniref:Uncharacterized protein n=1 Tax=Dovyalis caffra TaxID=77055 RepID=A0AAV1R698_9ROSI|nr:unnamed protein product [Dovyalis caffra]
MIKTTQTILILEEKKERVEIDEDLTMSSYINDRKGQFGIEIAERGDLPQMEINVPSDIHSMVAVRRKKKE